MSEISPGVSAPRRLGPRPMALHLAMAMATSIGAMAALPGARRGLVPWHDSVAPEAPALRAALAAADPDRLTAALAAECAGRMQAMLDGIVAYHRHPYRRDLPPVPELWREGSTRLLDYGGRRRGVPVLFVPSLVNRSYVLDLSRRRSMLRWLATRGIRPFLIDWGAPGPDERDYDLSDYVAGRLERALRHLLAETGRPVGLVGYCMGGNLALALALRRPDAVSALALLATPWDFHAARARHAYLFAALEGALDALVAAFGALPVDLLQAFFAALDPNLAARKFRRFAHLDPDSRAAEDFVALEDWANDGVPLAGKVARECLLGWYGRNSTMRGDWRIAGAPVDPAKLRRPALVALPRHDRIVPTASARALAERLPTAGTLDCPSGHIGMAVGGGAERGLWAPLRDWLVDHSG